MTTHARTFIGAAAGLALGAVLTLLAGPWAIAAPNAPGPALNTAMLADTATRTIPVTRAVAPRSTSSPLRTSERVDKKHDWAKTALIIGGSAGAGAGIGAIAKGKKGALIGAAIGGGAGALVEAIRR